MKNMTKKQFLESLKESYCRLAPVTHGVGVVATRRIPKGTDPFKYCDPFGGVIELPETELESFDAPEAAKKLVRDFCALQNGMYFVPSYGIDGIDKSFFLNHSNTPNMATIDHGEDFVAIRDIEEGEELTANYDEYHDTKEFSETD